MAETLKLFASVPKAMEDLLAQELTALGAQKVEPQRAGVAFQGTLETAYRACLWSRIANRILLPIAQFAAPTPEKLYGGVKQIRWSDHLTPDETIAVDFASSRSQITHTHFGSLKTKDAVCDQLRSVQGTRPNVDPINPDFRINVYVHEDQATVSIDLSGESLHKRGYREDAREAPMKENLAAAILAIGDWQKVAAAGGAFLDPMCGSGTLPIEAALIAANRAPGLKREKFGFQGWQGHVPMLWKRVLEEAKQKEVRDPRSLPKVVGYDTDFRAVRVALANVEKADLRGRVHVEKRELGASESIAPQGIVVLNPPYGERLGEVDELRELYRRIGDLFKQKFAGWKGFILTGSPELAKCVGLRAARRHVLFNGAIECRLLEYELY
jgi:23S rRNA (guanine2445-N2)-methyltransferase / 23S rRNA (guanine2069-N7)-methyltransferase